MRLLFSKRAELGIKAILYLSIMPKDKFFNAKIISKELNVPKEFVSKILQKLSYKGIVTSKKGKDGGFALKKPPEEIRILDIVYAIDGEGIFSKCVLGFENCSDQYPCPVHKTWATLINNIIDMLSSRSIGDFLEITHKKIFSFK